MCGRQNGHLGLTSHSTTGNALISLWATERPRRCGAAADGNDGPDAHGKSPWTTNCCCPPPSPNRLDNRLLRLPTGPWTTLRVAHIPTALTATVERSKVGKEKTDAPEFRGMNHRPGTILFKPLFCPAYPEGFSLFMFEGLRNLKIF